MLPSVARLSQYSGCSRGGPQIQQRLNQNKIESKFIDGLRVTDNNIIGVVEDVLLNEINPDLVKSIEKYGVNSVPVNAKNSDIIKVKGIKKLKLRICCRSRSNK